MSELIKKQLNIYVMLYMKLGYSEKEAWIKAYLKEKEIIQSILTTH